MFSYLCDTFSFPSPLPLCFPPSPSLPLFSTLSSQLAYLPSPVLSLFPSPSSSSFLPSPFPSPSFLSSSLLHSTPHTSLKLASYSHFEVYCGADIIIPQEDYKHVSTLTQGDRMVRVGSHQGELFVMCCTIGLIIPCI